MKAEEIRKEVKNLIKDLDGGRATISSVTVYQVAATYEVAAQLAELNELLRTQIQQTISCKAPS